MRPLKINPTFQNLIPPLTADEFNGLEESILSHGRCRDTIKTWKGTIVDGHNRYAICQKHGIPVNEQDTQEMRFASKKDAELWIIQNQLGRRNLTPVIRIKLALRKETLLRGKAKHNRKGCQGRPINVRKAIADDAHVGEQTVYRYMKIRELGTPELMRLVDTGEVAISAAHKGLDKGLDVTTRTVEVYYGLQDPYDIGNPRCKAAVIGNIDKVERLLGFIREHGDVVCCGGGVDCLRRKVGTQMRVVGRLLK